MEVLYFFALIGTKINDLLAIFSVVSTFILLFGPYAHGDLANYSLIGVAFGVLFQVSMFMTGMPARIGVFVPMTPLLANWLFGLSLFMVLLRLVFRRNEPRI
jgi:ABC-type antimicrobial peptide transport system permease subunit